MNQESFANSTIVVTGAASGIGKETSQRLISAGASVIALDRNEPDFEVEQYIQVDLANKGSIDAAVSAIGAASIDGLCNIAGVPGTLPDDVVARVNYLGLRHLTQAVLPRIRRGGAVVNLASVAGSKWRDHTEKYVELALLDSWDHSEKWIQGHDFLRVEAYRRFKEALIVWSQTYAGQYLQQHGVRMNCVSPGPVDTPILNDFRESMGRKNVEDLIELTGRPGTPQDIAPVVIFLLSESSRWIIGADITTDGGMSSARFAGTYRNQPASV